MPAAVDAQPVVSVEVPVKIAGVPYIPCGRDRLDDVLGRDEPLRSGRRDRLVRRQKWRSHRGKPLAASGHLVGTKTIPEVLRQVGEPAAFWIEAYSRTGQPTYTSILRSDLTGWSVNLALPREAVDGPLGVALLLGLRGPNSHWRWQPQSKS
jgi:hypothetical protein